MDHVTATAPTTEPAAAPRRPGGAGLRFWTTAEMRILRQFYPAEGPRVVARLPGRSAGAVQSAAHVHGIAYLGKRRPRPARWRLTDDVRRAIERTYTRGESPTRLAERLGLPKWRVIRWAAELGLTRPQRKESNWSEAEIALLAEHKHLGLEHLAKRLRDAGYRRSLTAIQVKRKRLRLAPAEDGRYSARAVGQLLGIDSKAAGRWAEMGILEAEHRGTGRTDAQGGDMWWIEHAALRRCLVANPHLVDLRKVRDPEWFINLIAGGPPDGRQHRRKKPQAAAQETDPCPR